MAYEYRSGSQSLELPNPYAVENTIRFVLGGVLIVIAIWLLFVARRQLAGELSLDSLASLIPIAGAVGVLAYAVRLISVGMSQLRFFFGRDRPRSLASELAQDAQGAPADGQALQETIRRGALQFSEPKGAINGMLYNLQKDLIVAPDPLQVLAQTQFRIAMVVAGIFVAFCVSMLLLSKSDHRPWIGLLYFGLAAFVALRPMRSAGQANVSDRLPILLILLAVLGPILLTLIGGLLPDISSAQFVGATFAMLICTGIGTTLFFVALRAQLHEPPPASSSNHQLALSMNCQPAQVLDELARVLQEGWREQIPNRRYILLKPEINLTGEGSGSFACDQLEETQPMPPAGATPLSLGECLANPEKKWVLFLQLFGALLILASAALIGSGAANMSIEALETDPASAFNTLLFAGALLIVGDYCFRGAHVLFGRFDFESTLYWLELRGNYQVASLDYGNVLQDRIKTRKNLVNIDTATMRMWIVEVSSVAFGKDGARLVRAMTGRKEEAQRLAESLARFAAEQSLVIAPTTAQDAARMQAMANLGLNQPVDPRALGALGLDPNNQSS